MTEATPHTICMFSLAPPSLVFHLGLKKRLGDPVHMKNGFSLIELSIVLVILGLLVGGILAGQSLIRAAELRSVTADLNKITTTMNAFRDKYFSLPGDLALASSFWSGVSNGNNDGLISYSSESLAFWTHLGRSGLIEGSYTGALVASDWVPGVNMLASRLAPGGYIVRTSTIPYSTASGILMLFAANNATSHYLEYPMLRPNEAWNMDQKIDDGKADTGKFYAYNAYVPPTDRCVTSSSYVSGPSSYYLDKNSIDCLIYYRY